MKPNRYITFLLVVEGRGSLTESERQALTPSSWLIWIENHRQFVFFPLLLLGYEKEESNHVEYKNSESFRQWDSIGSISLTITQL